MTGWIVDPNTDRQQTHRRLAAVIPTVEQPRYPSRSGVLRLRKMTTNEDSPLAAIIAQDPAGLLSLQRERYVTLLTDVTASAGRNWGERHKSRVTKRGIFHNARA